MEMRAALLLLFALLNIVWCDDAEEQSQVANSLLINSEGLLTEQSNRVAREANHSNTASNKPKKNTSTQKKKNKKKSKNAAAKKTDSKTKGTNKNSKKKRKGGKVQSSGKNATEAGAKENKENNSAKKGVKKGNKSKRKDVKKGENKKKGTKKGKNSKRKDVKKGENKKKEGKSSKKRKNSRRKNKAKKGKNSKNKDEKGRKNEKKKKNKGKKGNGIAKKKKKGLNKQSSCPADQVDTTCITNALTAMEYEETTITNFNRQLGRILASNNIVGLKLQKNNTFDTVTNSLLSALGGDPNNLVCSDGVGNSTGALANATTNYRFLAGCNTTVTGNCSIPSSIWNSTTQSKLLACNASIQAYVAQNTACSNASTAVAACSCWSQQIAAWTNITNQQCVSISSAVDKALTAARGNCIGKFGACQKAQMESVTYVSACSSGTVKSLSTLQNITMRGGSF